MKNFLRHLFIPHESNNHRSRILHHDSLLLILVFLLSGIIVIQGTQRQYPGVLGDSTQINITDLLKDTNIDREAHGLAPLVLNPELTAAAQMKARDMFAKDYWAHVSPDGTTPWVWIKDAGYNYLYAGENLARGFTTSDDVVTAWMNSPEHRANLLSSNYTDIGFAIEEGTLTGTHTTLVVQEFGSPYNANGVAQDATTSTPQKVIASAGELSPTPPAQVVVGTMKIEQPSALSAQRQIPNQPLVDANSLKRNIAFGFLIFFLVLFAVDAIIMERKQIARIFSHNVDHMLFLLFILLAGIIIGTGVIL